jgi:flagellin
MPSVSNIAVGAAMAGAAASKARHGMNESITRLSTGVRSMYGGDAAGQSIANSIGAKGASFAVAARNAEDGISFLQAAESVLLELAGLMTRLREIGVAEGNNDLLSTSDLAALNAEAAAIASAFTNVAAQTKFNGLVVVGDADIAIAVDDSGNTSTVGQTAAFTSMATDATKAQTAADTGLSEVGTALGQVAAGMSALKGYQSVASSTAANLNAAAARIQDTDYAMETASLTKNTILNQAAMAMVAQANDAQAAVLSVIQ